MSNWGSKVDDAILEDLLPGGELGAAGPQPEDGGLKATALALQVVERHLAQLSPQQLAALAFLRMEGGRWEALAGWYLEHVNLTGPIDPLLQALERVSLIKNFKGVRGNLWGGKVPAFGGGGGPR